ncbi:unnamed protein product [Urochloa decumbens]|uniref:AAA+ ATPase domain-containing protein n=1 Tax=Urochloa decumbens TaxID=240449 RepID=A0ABC8YGC9_9POAL
MDLATGAIGSIICKLAELLEAEYKLQKGVKEQVESLTRELRSAHAFLQEIDKVPPYQLNEQIKIWAYQVREASYDMEDILDTFLVCVKGGLDAHAVDQDSNKLKHTWEKMTAKFSKFKERHKIARAIEGVKKHLQEVTERRGRYTVESFVVKPSPSLLIDPRLAAMYKEVSQLIGIDKSREELASLLSFQGNEMSDKNLKIVSVVGVGGLGKTTLARALYENLKAKFSCSAFVPVGRNPDLKKVFRDILIELGKGTYMHHPEFTILDEKQLINKLREFLGRQRYFIVVDDVWDIKSREMINLAFVDNNIGSRIIITTRNLEVATGEVYKLQPLSDDDSKKLFYARNFGGEDKCPDNQRQKVSEAACKILRKCGGIPLAIITMASLLVGKSMEEWLEVCNSTGFCDKDKEQLDDITWILSLSYYDLPSHLKTCLLYLSVFPEDHLIKKDDLIWMWIGEGFVNGKPGNGLFEIGERYFNDLINRSLIQPVVNKKRGIVDRCRVHDMILDLIRSLSREENFAMALDNSEDTLLRSNARRLALQNRAVKDTPLHNHPDTARARSFFAFMCSFGPRVQLRSLKLLRVLYLEDCGHIPFYEHVGDLLHLRYLGIREHDEVNWELPKEIGAVKFLQVLYLEGVRGLLLPSSVGMLTQLVCLRARNMSLPGGKIMNLTSLQELDIVPGDDDKSMGQFVKDLGNLRELRVLRIDISRMGRRMQSDLLKSLGNLDKMQFLQLVGAYKSTNYEAWDEGLLPRGLRQLFLYDMLYCRLPSCIDPLRLPSLSHLFLEVFELADQCLKILGGLPELCYLELHIDSGRATLTGTATRVYFYKLRSFLLHDSMVQFVVNEEESSVSFTIWDGSDDDAPAFGPKRKQGNCSVARPVMPNLEVLYFHVDVNDLTARHNGSCDNLGLEYLVSLEEVGVDLCCSFADVGAAEKEETALKHAIQVHPNRPTLKLRSDHKHKGNSLWSDEEYSSEEEEEATVLSAGDEGATQSRRSDQEEEVEEATPWGR